MLFSSCCMLETSTNIKFCFFILLTFTTQGQGHHNSPVGPYCLDVLILANEENLSTHRKTFDVQERSTTETPLA